MIKPHLDQLINQEKRQNMQSHRHHLLQRDQQDAVKIAITNCLRVIRNAWHFCYALRLVFKVVCGGFGIALLTP